MSAQNTTFNSFNSLYKSINLDEQWDKELKNIKERRILFQQFKSNKASQKKLEQAKRGNNQ